MSGTAAHRPAVEKEHVFSHKSVLLREAVEGLAVRPDGIYVDGTLGGGGHALAVAQRLQAGAQYDENKDTYPAADSKITPRGGRLIGIDRDEDALRAAEQRLAKVNDRITLVHGNFMDIPAILDGLSIEKADGILLDLGVSSWQLDERERGFSYMQPEAPLDMRMDRSQGMTAEQIVNTYDTQDLTRIFREYGEERYASRVASNIAKQRAKAPLKTAGDLNRIIEASVPKKQTGGHPSKRVFQALRIEVNGELAPLQQALSDMIERLNENGRLCVITFHSLEDRIVKNAFRTAQDPCICPKDFPVCVCGRKSKGRILTKKPILPSEEEMRENSRARSAKLRIFCRHIPQAKYVSETGTNSAPGVVSEF